MQVKFSKEVDTIAGYARDEAMRTGSYGIGVDHLFLGILRHGDNDVCGLLKGLDLDLSEFKGYIDSFVMQPRAVPYNDFDKVRLTRRGQSVMSLAAYEALRRGGFEVCTSHLFLAMMREGQSCTKTYLEDLGYGYDSLAAMMAEQEMLGVPKPAQEKETPVQKIDLSGALSEQLGILFKSVSEKSNPIS